MAPRGLVDDNPAILEFHDVVLRFTMSAACGRPYVRVGELTKWLRSRNPNEAKTRIENLLNWTHREIQFLPMSLNLLSSGNDCCLLVFSILLELGWEQQILLFQGHGIYDRNLPVEKHRLYSCLSKLPNSQTFADQFYQKQWSFCPVKLELGMNRHFQKDEILPFQKKERITDKGGTATLWQVEVLEEFVGSSLRHRVKEARYESKSDNLGWRYQFALKSFEESHSQTYHNEKQAFDGLQQHNGMVRALANYTYQGRRAYQREAMSEFSYHILLEFGDLDLADYFAVRHPPVRKLEVKAFWADIFEIGYTVRDIHNLKLGDGKEFYGWHADIKPDNILSIQGKFKLADPGFAFFLRKSSSEEFPMVEIRGGTETYGAPEVRRDSIHPVPQSIDIWSLGCVFSLVATWVVLGYQGICEFNEVRQRAIRRIIEQQRHPAGYQAEGSRDHPVIHINDGDYFHDGYDVLPEVKSWHQYLRSAVRKSDHVTSRVLDLVDWWMLCRHPTDRLKAVELCKKLKEVVDDEIPEETPLKLPTVIMETLLDFDNNADSHLATPAPIRRQGKSNLNVLPLLKTTHRSGLLNDELERNLALLSTDQTAVSSLSQNINNLSTVMPGDSKPLSGESSDPGIGTSPKSKHPPRDILMQSAPMTPAHFLTGNQSTAWNPPGRSRRQKSRITTAPQNVFQAREAIQAREAGNYLNKTRKGPFLSRFFVNRDLKFLIDNAESMRPFWYEATYLLETLVLKASGQDENGMDLAFTTGSVHLNNQKRAKKFLETMNHREAIPANEVNTDIRKSLGDIFLSYLDDLENSKKFAHKKKVKDLTIIVLTDGKWAGITEKEQQNSVNHQIAKFIMHVKQLTRGVSKRPVSIEFVQFGDDPQASMRLQELDDNLTGIEGNGDIPDVIDTEPSFGDVNKMLVGSFIDEYDNYGEDDNDSKTIRPMMESPEGYADMGSESRMSIAQPISPTTQSPNPSLPTMSIYGAPIRSQTQQSLASNAISVQGRRSQHNLQASGSSLSDDNTRLSLNSFSGRRR